MTLPFLPDDAPFSEDQKSWLAGFYAVSSHGKCYRAKKSATSEDQSAITANILFGTQTGNSEGFAEEFAVSLRSEGINAHVNSLDDVEVEAPDEKWSMSFIRHHRPMARGKCQTMLSSFGTNSVLQRHHALSIFIFLFWHSVTPLMTGSARRGKQF